MIYTDRLNAKLIIAVIAASVLVACRRASPLRTAPASTYSALSGEVTSISAGNKPYIQVATKIQGRTSTGSLETILNFQMGDFAVTENGDPVVIESISYHRAPISCVLVLDRSGSMGSISYTTSPAYALNQAVKAFVSGLIDTDMVMLIDFGEEIKIRTPLTSSRKQLIDALDSAENLGWTSLWAAAGVGIDEMAKSPLSRRILIVMTDGGDNSSDQYAGAGDYSTTVNQAIARALAKGIAVDCVGYGSYDSELQSLAGSTGGRFNAASAASDLTAIYQGYIPTEIDNTLLHYRTRLGGRKEVTVYLNYGYLFTSFASAYSD